MFLVPVNTDAPIYHFPWGTVSFIIASTLVFAGAALGWLPVESYVLAYGDGLHPLQWLTSLFIHDGLLHLAGNMFFLWGFGLIVEGKLGWRKFLPVFLGLGVVESALEQACLQNASGSSLGASAAIMGLMAIAVVWAPKNEIVFAYGLLFPGIMRAGTIDLTILTFALLLTGSEVLSLWWLDVHASAAVLHLVGGLLGFGMGAAMLKQGLVDCEGWDLFSVWSGKHRSSADLLEQANTVVGATTRRVGRQSKNSSRKRRPRIAHSLPRSASELRISATEARIRELIALQKPRAALREWNQLQHLLPQSRLGQQELYDLAQGLCRIGMWQDAVTLMEEFVDRFTAQADRVRVRAAAILLHRLGRPKAALRMIEPVDVGAGSEAKRERCRQLAAAARVLIDSGVIELRRDSFRPATVPQTSHQGVESRC